MEAGGDGKGEVSAAGDVAAACAENHQRVGYDGVAIR